MRSLRKRFGLLALLLIGFLWTQLFACSEGSPPKPTLEVASGPTIAIPETNSSAAATQPISIATPFPPTLTAPVQGLVDFDGTSAFRFLEDQVAFGPRWPGSEGNDAAGDAIARHLQETGWTVEEQLFNYQGIEGRNIIGRSNLGRGDVVILGAHYDTRKVADKTPGSELPVPGAVDGASGVAVLMELARSLELDRVENELWLAFFDVEDNGRGGMPGFDWIVGSTYMAYNLTVTPQSVVVVDMVGDKDQQLYFEGNSDPELRETLWQLAAELGFGNTFIPEVRHTMIDDHLPFVRMGFTAVDIIDFDYPYWHTVEDTVDKASAESLYRVGRLLEVWLEGKDGG